MSSFVITGFNAFHGVPENPTELLVNHIQSQPNFFKTHHGRAELIPCIYKKAELWVDELLATDPPDFLICFGVHGMSETIRIETLGKNYDDSQVPDNDGVVIENTPIIPNGPKTLPVTFPATKICQAMQAASLPVALSDSAGAFLCNHLLYYSLAAIERKNVPIRTGFIHVPAPEFVSLNELVKAVEVCIDCL